MDRFEQAAVILEKTGRYRILRQMPSLGSQDVVPDEPTSIGMVLDLETTGLDAGRDEVIEFGAIKFEFGASGRIYRILGTFSQLHQPSRPIPPGIVRLTGITDADVAGHSIDDAALQAFAADAVLVIAHNARFDRPFCERYWPIFRDKSWGCSCFQIPWLAEGHTSTKLQYLINDFGYFYEGHRAIDDCCAVLTLLSRNLRVCGKVALSRIIDAARTTTIRLWAEGSPIAANHLLKSRSYKWNKDRRSWYVDLSDEQVEFELTFLGRDVYGKPVPDLPVEPFTALNRFSLRVDQSR